MDIQDTKIPGDRRISVSSLPFTERVLILLRRLPPWARSFLLLLPAVLWYGVFFLSPLAQMVLISFGERGPYGGVEPGFYLDSYQELTNPLYVNIFVVTLKMALIGTYAWETILDSQGALSNLLQATGVIHQPLQILYSQVAIFIGIVYNYLPLMVFPLYVSLERMARRRV